MKLSHSLKAHSYHVRSQGFQLGQYDVFGTQVSQMSGLHDDPHWSRLQVFVPSWDPLC